MLIRTRLKNGVGPIHIVHNSQRNCSTLFTRDSLRLNNNVQCNIAHAMATTGTKRVATYINNELEDREPYNKNDQIFIC